MKNRKHKQYIKYFIFSFSFIFFLFIFENFPYANGDEAVKTIQRAYRNHRAKKTMGTLTQERNERRQRNRIDDENQIAATMIQGAYRRNKAKKILERKKIAAQQFLIGIEIESGICKVTVGTRERTGFIINDPGCNISWCLADDTFDPHFKGDFQKNEFKANLECSSIGGYKKDSILVLAKDIQKILLHLRQQAQAEHKTIELTPDIIRSILSEGGRNIRITSNRINQLSSTQVIPEQKTQLESSISRLKEEIEKGTFSHQEVLKKQKTLATLQSQLSKREKSHSSTAASSGDTLRIVTLMDPPGGYEIRPQITYQVPLKFIPALFKRFEKNEGIKNFLISLELPTAQKESETQISDQSQKILDLLDIFKQHRNEISKMNANLKGFLYLFLYYWKTLFNNKKTIEGNEPGLKNHLFLMSRIPFSQLFDSLQPKEKESFKQFVSPIIPHLLDDNPWILRSFLTDYPNEKDSKTISPLDQNALNIKEWYISIVEEDQRQVVHSLNAQAKKTDKLSPHGELMTEFQKTGKGDETELIESMGGVDLPHDASGLALIEMRGYVKPSSVVEGSHKSRNCEDVYNFVKKEAEWFFSL